jgi:pyruvate dehydrogenase E1 component
MVVDEKDMIHYIMLYNDNESQPQKPEGCEEGIIRGAYVIKKPVEEGGPLVRLLGSGPILKNVVAASEKLVEYGVRTEIWSVTSYGELRREGVESERIKRLDPSDVTNPYVVSCFGDAVPTVAASDYIAAVPEMIQRWVGGSFCVLGTDGYGRSDTRDALRKFFEIDSDSIVVGALSLLEKDGSLESGTVASAVEMMGIDMERFDVTV